MNKLQSRASDPNISVWVAASAGTGKTKILTDRVLRLLLNGVAFNKILCLTFTNAAAYEMYNRINEKLKNWSGLPKDELTQQLTSLLAKAPSIKKIELAAQLYQLCLQPYNKIPIYTIHSFCQKILKRFPLEAGVSASFQILDDIKSRQLKAKSYDMLFSNSKENSVNEFFITNFHTFTLEKILSQIIDHKLDFKKYFNSKNIDFDALMKKQEGLKNNKYPFFLQDLKELHTFLEQFPQIFNEHIVTIIYELLKQKDELDNLENWQKVFYTKEGGVRKNILNTNLKKNYPEFDARIGNLKEKFIELDQIEKLKETFFYTKQLVNLSKNFINIYDELKNELNYLDFDDLIFYTNQLLLTSEAREWVLYKLDGGIEHILIDEAQDTSPAQWSIIQNLIEEFYAGEGINPEVIRTIFVVGDEKQSIFSFQGADLNAFHLNHKYFQRRLIDAGKIFETITLQCSYRSLKPILDITFNIFQDIKCDSPFSFISENPPLLAFREHNQSKVELWPLVVIEKNKELFWPINYTDLNITPQQELAKKIAIYIRDAIDKKTILPSVNRPVSYEDFLIVVRKRDKLAKEIIHQLKAYSLPTAGIDRILLSENIAILDLLSIAKFVLFPEDDLNLACLLKSPIIDLTNQEIENLKITYPGLTLWQALQQQNLLTGLLTEFINLYTICNASNFFHYIVDYLSYRQVFIDKSEIGTNEAINELLFLSYNYANNVSKSLLDFIWWFEENEIEIKRDIESSQKIKLMTIHNAKGLQAPIIILCDTTSIPVNKDNFFWDMEEQVFSFSKNSKNSPFFAEIKSIRVAKAYQEYLRLFYVALTRAEDYLIICGYSPEKKIDDDCWYSLAKKTIEKMDTLNIDEKLIYPRSFSPEYSKFPQVLNNQEEVQITLAENNSPDIYLNNISAKINHPIDIDLSKLLVTRSVRKVYSPLNPNTSLKYGKIIHKILEDTMKSKDLALFRKHPLIPTLPDEFKIKLNRTFTYLINNPSFIDLLNYEIKTEVNIGANNETEIQIGRIDLMAINHQEVQIIDYKSDVNPSRYYYNLPQSYRSQLDVYHNIIQIIYPAHKIICKILWLETGVFTITKVHLTELPA